MRANGNNIVRGVCWAVVCQAAVALCCLGGCESADNPKVHRQTVSCLNVDHLPDDLPAEKLLEALLIEIDVKDMPLETVLKGLSGVTELDLAADWAELATAGVNKRTPVTLRLQNASLGRVLRALLNGAGGTKLLNYDDPVNRKVRISTHESFVRVRVYDVIARGLVMGGRVMDEGQDVPADFPDRVAALITRIRQEVEPDTWHESGDDGRPGTIVCEGRYLIVTQTNAVHLPVEEFLEKLRAEAAPVKREE